MKLLLRQKVAGLAIFSALLPVLGLAILIAAQDKKSTRTIEAEIDAIISNNLNHAVIDIYGLCRVANNLIQLQVNRTLGVADFVLEDNGGLHFGDEKIIWQATNQYTQETKAVGLPQMFVGDTPITPNTSFSEPSPVVDQVKDLVGGTCTIFQRINAEGDMLRVATNVENANAHRAVGTYIPAINTDGEPNPVIHRVVNERAVYEGPAYVVNRWYLTAYRPIFDDSGYVVGMLYVGVRRDEAASLKKAIYDAEIGPNGYSWVMYGKDQARAGEFILTGEAFPHGKNINDIIDAKGQRFFEQIREDALAKAEQRSGATGSKSVMWEDVQGKEHKLEIKYVYFKPWDWVLGVTALAEDFSEPHKQIAKVFDEIFFATLFGAIVLLIFIFFMATWMGGIIARPISFLTSIARHVADGELADAQQEMNDCCQSRRDLSKARDETGDLFRAIQRMIGNLQQLVVEMKGASGQLTSSAEDINTNAQQQVSAAQDFSSSSTQIAAAVREISTTSVELTQTMKKATTSARQTAEVAGEGRSHLDGMRDGVTDLSVATQSVSGKLSIIAEKANNINNVVTTIAKVADQTNLLSLNAAIEAEKAGEFGLGFAVVAREIRRLADQTAVATLDIEQMVKEMQSSVNAGVMEMDKFNEAVRTGVETVNRLSGQMENIIIEVEALTPRFESVQEGMEAQTQGAEQISDAIASLNAAAQQTKVALEGFQGAAGKLNLAVTAVNGGIARFKTEDDQGNAPESNAKPS
ncbi:methyl-accepting chemotaxis protein [Cerasicoccus maritimus]|uniref:methyl-accepting chemotaxis protein n=1 Tax=Cerasicoccus maritimus TaxID=490089 RepID=UPI0028526F0E|nr:methyl-accepting chemotaxis protein [Cerasicoccus maritimus]